MDIPVLLLASFIVVGFVGIVDGDYRVGRSLNQYPYPKTEQTNDSRSNDNCGAVKIQGLIGCKENGQFTPQEGAKARVTCIAQNQEGYETAPFTMATPNTNEKGYFMIDLGKFKLPSYKLSSCKIFLEDPGFNQCNVPTDINGGQTGARLTIYKQLDDHSLLYSLPPFVYTPSNH